jgi:hypothetical protein
MSNGITVNIPSPNVVGTTVRIIFKGPGSGQIAGIKSDSTTSFYLGGTLYTAKQYPATTLYCMNCIWDGTQWWFNLNA